MFPAVQCAGASVRALVHIEIIAGSVVTTGIVPPGFVVGAAPGESGLYIYETAGFEEIDAPGGARHDCPERTFMMLQPGGCGMIVRWAALAERWDEQEVCPGESGMSLTKYTSFHEWFGRSDLLEYACATDEAPAIPAVLGSGSYACSSIGRTEIFEVEGIGPDTLLVAGKSVPVFHVMVISTLSGASEGSAEIETGCLEGSSLVVRRIVRRMSMNDSAIGTVMYNEEYEINVVALVPISAIG